jgi:iron complex transport system permease protein
MSTTSSVPGTSKVLAMPPGMPETSLLVRPRRTAGVLVGLGGLLLGCSMVAVGHGMVTIAPEQVLAILADQLHWELPWTFTTQQEMILLAIRLPRVLLGILIGAGLAVSGAAI